jgi:SNF2 family DNA or RNA helicase
VTELTKLENVLPGARVRGIRAGEVVTVIHVEWLGEDVLEVMYRDEHGNVHAETLFRDAETQLEIESATRPFDFCADGMPFKLAVEAFRIRNAYLFDPLIAVHTSMVDPLPHQVSAVYEHMLPKQPLRFLLADDPGAGKTIMSGLLIKELMIRGDVERCLICVPGGLADQWQDELSDKFGLEFQILTRDMVAASLSGNPFAEHDHLIIRMDQVARSEELQEKLKVTDWDLVIVDEAHKMSATVFSGEVKETKRYRLGRLLGQLTRHLLLLTATPHNGKDEDFQLFLALLDPDRFEGRFRDGARAVNVDDIMRRLVKEQMVTFEGKRLFPERIAETVQYDLSPEELSLYDHVTAYVREEFNRAERLSEGRRGQVGFALTTLQRRLASSPEAIYRSLESRRKRLEKRLAEARQEHRMAQDVLPDLLSDVNVDELDEVDSLAADEFEEREQLVTDLASAAQTVRELEAEVEILKRLAAEADAVRRSGRDRKWEQLSNLLQDDSVMRHQDGRRRKLVIFTEHRDTLLYLATRIRNLFGDPKSVVTIQGNMGREERKKVQALFTQDKDVHVLIATDAAGEGINLQVANLMVNYDLPWNPNRLEQRFGRIHRIGQTEVCRLWNLVAKDTQESFVFQRLLEKLEEERRALGGQVFDVLGRVLENRVLKEL